METNRSNSTIHNVLFIYHLAIAVIGFAYLIYAFVKVDLINLIVLIAIVPITCTGITLGLYKRSRWTMLPALLMIGELLYIFLVFLGISIFGGTADVPKSFIFSYLLTFLIEVVTLFYAIFGLKKPPAPVVNNEN